MITKTDKDDFAKYMLASGFDRLDNTIGKFDQLKEKVAKDILEASANNKKNFLGGYIQHKTRIAFDFG